MNDNAIYRLDSDSSTFIVVTVRVRRRAVRLVEVADGRLVGLVHTGSGSG
jgi:hypothetical protein